MLSELNLNYEWLPERILFLAVHGSRAYGMDTPDSDLDLKGVAVAPREFYLGFRNVFEQDTFKNHAKRKREEVEGVIYELKKFFRLASQCNPNIIEVLFSDEFLHVTDAGEKIISNRHLFISKRAKYTFSGYAHDQLKRMKKQAESCHGYNSKEFNTKNATHLIRLLRMCREILKNGEVNVRREDADYLLKIRRGEVPYSEVIEEAHSIDDECARLYHDSNLPDKPDMNAIEKLCIETIEKMI